MHGDSICDHLCHAGSCHEIETCTTRVCSWWRPQSEERVRAVRASRVHQHYELQKARQAEAQRRRQLR
eukprot:COSAG01_NODE_46486_length_399_cov_11.080000_1_plen_67_part_10